MVTKENLAKALEGARQYLSDLETGKAHGCAEIHLVDDELEEVDASANERFKEYLQSDEYKQYVKERAERSKLIVEEKRQEAIDSIKEYIASAEKRLAEMCVADTF